MTGLTGSSEALPSPQLAGWEQQRHRSSNRRSANTKRQRPRSISTRPTPPSANIADLAFPKACPPPTEDVPVELQMQSTAILPICSHMHFCSNEAFGSGGLRNVAFRNNRFSMKRSPNPSRLLFFYYCGFLIPRFIPNIFLFVI